LGLSASGVGAVEGIPASYWLSVGLGVAFMVRSLFCGVIVDEERLTIVSWFYRRGYAIGVD
jgi:hypothetical protein